MQPQNAQNNFFGIRVSKPGINVNNAGTSGLIYQSDYSTNTWYDGSGNPVIQQGLLPSGNYGMEATTGTGSFTFGTLTDGTLGIQSQDSNGNVLFEMNGSTWYWYDITTGKNVMQVGLLPDGSYGWAVAASGYNVSDGFS